MGQPAAATRAVMLVVALVARVVAVTMAVTAEALAAMLGSRVRRGRGPSPDEPWASSPSDCWERAAMADCIHAALGGTVLARQLCKAASARAAHAQELASRGGGLFFFKSQF